MTENTTETAAAALPLAEALKPLKPKRQPGYRWVRFYSLRKGENFRFDKFTVTKVGFALAQIPSGRVFLFCPWARVHSLRPVKGAAK